MLVYYKKDLTIVVKIISYKMALVAICALHYNYYSIAGY